MRRGGRYMMQYESVRRGVPVRAKVRAVRIFCACVKAGHICVSRVRAAVVSPVHFFSEHLPFGLGDYLASEQRVCATANPCHSLVTGHTSTLLYLIVIDSHGHAAARPWLLVPRGDGYGPRLPPHHHTADPGAAPVRDTPPAAAPAPATAPAPAPAQLHGAP
ncbi:hypothetical protein O3P69_014733 [Scylla paramamosain]|uniref:Uncharacterized protein n=1 Tax=Scylla paramamosain TaxID=85552 RepID=A0AAW0TYK3_SCYPA